MRAATTYRAARRERAKTEARANGEPFAAVWAGYKLKPSKKKTDEKYRPSIPTGKTYAANGKRECARRVRQMEKHHV